MKKLKENIGISMAEVLIVVAIIGILGGVAFVNVWSYQRSMGQLERDAIAKEIFVAAQNHLTVAYGEGYPGLTVDDFGTEDNGEVGDYFIINNDTSGAGVLNQMLPFGSIDETVRSGGSYIIHYQKDTGMVLDVFFCTRSGSPRQFNVDLTTDDYDPAMSARESKEDRKTGAWRNISNGPILGYYGGADAALLPTTTLLAPSITVHNEEKLYVEVTDPNKNVMDKDGYRIAALKLMITGVSSKAQKAFILELSSIDGRVEISDLGSNYTVTLDDITTNGLHFGEITADTTEQFIPGENIEIQAVAYSTTAPANIAYSAKSTTNSLFGNINSAQDTVDIRNIRHLENLDKDISNLAINIASAEQTDSFSWDTFQKEIYNIENNHPRGTEPDSDSDYSKAIYKYNSRKPATTKGYYLPIAPDYELTYDGQNHSISDVAVKDADDAGLFGSTSKVEKISNLELVDFTITGTDSAGALAGTLDGCTVTNVLVRNTTSLAKKITATGDAGGLIGKLEGGTVQYSAAAVIVSGQANAGGLIGDASGSIIGCYSGGHTKSGSYEEWVKANPFDVTGATVGGLVGTSNATISDSYSTCSVSGTSVAGGFAGYASGSITNCYATGLVDGTTKYAFLGSGDATLSENYYYRAINKVEKTENGKTVTEPMEPYLNAGEVSNHLNSAKPIDLNADSYNTFVGEWANWNPARAFDSALVQYYSGRYTLRTVDELNPNAELPTGYEDWNQLFVKNHYGDWPSPEVFFVNTALY